MRTRLVTWSGVILLACGAYVVGQQDSAEMPKPDGPFVVVGGDSNVLLDTKTGRTWLLSELPQNPLPVWLPLSRIDSAEKAMRELAEADKLRREADIRRRFTSEIAEGLIEKRRQAEK